MKTNIMARIACLALIVVAAIGANAQAHKMKATIPFDFRAGAVYLPAGDYIVSSPTPGMLRIVSNDMRHISTVIVHGVEAPTASKNAKLIFHQYGGSYWLSQVWTPNLNSGEELAPSAAEREAAAAGNALTVAMITAR